METFASLRDYRGIRLVENKDRFIQKNTVLTDDQKKEVLDFFRSHANLENRIQNWNYNIPYETFKQVMDSVDTAEKRLKKQTKELRQQNGLEGLIKGKDYNLVYQEGSITIYQPLTHKASRVIASNMVEPKIWCKSSVMKWSPKEVLPEGEPMKGDLYPGAKWCISMETDKHWKSYTSEGKKFFIVCNPNARRREKKVCFTYDSRDEFLDLTYADDFSTRKFSLYPELKKVIDEYCEKQRSENLKNLSKYLNKETGKYDYLNREFTPRDLIKDGKFVVPIGVWEDNFDCSRYELTSLEGAPEKIKGSFWCSYSKLTTLEGSPREVGGDFWCDHSQLTSLKGAPREVGGDFVCTDNHLTSLEGCPEKVGGNFWCYVNYLASLEGAPKEVGGNFECDNSRLTSLEGAPRKVGGNFECEYNKLTSLKGAPEYVGGNFSCIKNKLTSLKGAPREVGGSFLCRYNKLTTLEGCPEKVGRNFSCSDNPLVSLEGKPKYIGGEFYNSHGGIF